MVHKNKTKQNIFSTVFLDIHTIHLCISTLYFQHLQPKNVTIILHITEPQATELLYHSNSHFHSVT